jgi:tetratricopeptide (TPR) repeat protein
MNGKKLLIIILVLCLLILISVYIKKQISSSKAIDETELLSKGADLTAEEAEDFETKLVKDPDDLSLRIMLFNYYSASGCKSGSMLEKRIEHLLWIIENCPDKKIAGLSLLTFVDSEKTYKKLKKLWLKQTEKYADNAVVWGNAGYFFMFYDLDLAEKLFKKAKELEPDNPEWPERLSYVYSTRQFDPSATVRESFAQKAVEEMEEALTLADIDEEKLMLIPELAKNAFNSGDFKKASKYAKEALALAEQSIKAEGDTNWYHWDIFHGANIVLGRIALSSWEMEAAREHLLAAGNVKSTPTLSSFGPTMTLAKELLEQGESAVVLKYLRLCRNFWEHDMGQLDEWIYIVERGEIPNFGPNLNY